MAEKATVPATKNSGNTFRDLGVPQPELAKIKSDMALVICKTIHSRGLSQSEAAAIIGVDQAKASAISRGITKGCSVDRLMTFLNRLDMDVDIRLKPKSKRNKIAHTRVTGIAGRNGPSTISSGGVTGFPHF